MAPPQQHGLIAWLGIKRARGQTPPLGERELVILDLLWQHPRRSAQHILELLPEKNIGLNTVQSTIERLHRKQLLSREKAGRQYLYSPTQSKADFIGRLLGDIAAEITHGDMAPMISGFQKFLESEKLSSEEIARISSIKSKTATQPSSGNKGETP